MNDLDKAARGIVILVVAIVAIVADKIDAHIDELTRQDLEAAEYAYQQSGAAEAAEALVLWEMKLEGRCAPNVPKAAAIPCPDKPRPVRQPAEHVWTVGPALKAVR